MKTDMDFAFQTISNCQLVAVVGGVNKSVGAGGAKSQVPTPPPGPSKPSVDGSICRAGSIAYGATLGTIAGSALPVVGNAIAGIAGAAIGQVVGEQTCPP